MMAADRISTLQKWVLAVGCLALTAGLLAHAYLGSSMRYSGDDYCYAWSLTRFGFWDSQVMSYFHEMPYHGNRYSLTLFSTLISLLPPQFNGWLPALTLMLWLGGLMFAVRAASRAAAAHLSVLETYLGAALLVVLTLQIAPSVVQSLYWRSGMLPYLAPLVGMSFLAGAILWGGPGGKPSAGGLILIAILAVLTGGFSETGALVQVGLIGAGFLIGWVRRVLGGAKRVILLPLAAALCGSLIALGLLALSPSIRGQVIANRFLQDLPGLLSLALTNVKVFLVRAFKAQVAAQLLAAGAPLVISFHRALSGEGTEPAPLWRLATVGAGLLFAVLLLLFSAMLPFAYVQDSYPEERALILPSTFLVAGLGIGGWILGRETAERLRAFKRGASIAALLGAALLLVSWAYPLGAGWQELGQAPRYQKWARFWDQRHASILEAKRAGERDVDVIEIDHIIPDVGELSPDPGYWYNNCAAGWYGLRTISATLPGWDEEP